MDNKHMDKLIDDAFTKDKAAMHEQSDMPPASLLDKVRATKPVVSASASSGGAFASLTMKVIGLVASLAVIVSVVYFTTKPESVTPVVPAITAPPVDTVQATPVAPSAAVSLKDSLKVKPKAVSKDSISILPRTLNSDKDLIFPGATEFYEKDTAVGKLKKK